MINSEQQKKLGLLDLLVLTLSVYVLITLLLDIFFEFPPEVSKILALLDNIICVFFLVEFSIRFKNAKNKLQFMKWGWIDLISSIPNVDILRGGRALRLIRLLRILRAFRSTKHLVTHVFKSKAQGTFTTVSILSVILIIFSSISVLQLEVDHPDHNIMTAEDALWWSAVTITTVGYGDKFPVTTGGRIVGVILMVAGVGLFGTYTAFISSWFLTEKKEEPTAEDENNH